MGGGAVGGGAVGAMEPEVMRRRVAGARVARLATVDPAGRPTVVPCTFALATGVPAGDAVYTAVDEKPKGTRELARLRNIEARPEQVAVVVDHYEEDWSRLWWVRLRGRGRVLRGGDERERALELLGRKYEQYREARPGGAVIALDVEEWKGWSAA